MELLGGLLQLLQFLALLSLLFPFYLLGRGVWELRESLSWSSYTAQQVVVSHHGVLLPLPEEQSPWHLRCGPSANWSMLCWQFCPHLQTASASLRKKADAADSEVTPSEMPFKIWVACPSWTGSLSFPRFRDSCGCPEN